MGVLAKEAFPAFEWEGDVMRKFDMKELKGMDGAVAIYAPDWPVNGVIVRGVQDLEKAASFGRDAYGEVVMVPLVPGKKYYWETNQGEGPGYGDSCELRLLTDLQIVVG